MTTETLEPWIMGGDAPVDIPGAAPCPFCGGIAALQPAHERTDEFDSDEIRTVDDRVIVSRMGRCAYSPNAKDREDYYSSPAVNLWLVQCRDCGACIGRSSWREAVADWGVRL